MSIRLLPAPLQRAIAMERDELRFRVECEARKAIGRARSAIVPATWHRQDFTRCIAADASAGRGDLAASLDAAKRGDWHEAHRGLAAHFAGRASAFPLTPQRLRSLSSRITTRFPDAATDAARRGDAIIGGKYDLLGYRDLTFGSPPRWNYDPVHGRVAPGGFWASVRYLDPSAGDHKVIWEINRHQHFLALGRAFHLTGDRRYYDAFVDHIEDWIVANPPLQGTNWASMLELAFRALSWLWALHFFAAPAANDGPTAPPWTVDLVIALDRQLDHVEQNLSRYFSPNTHLSGEALALYVAGMALPELASSKRRAHVGGDVLLAEATRQVRADGGHAELSAHYHRYSTDFYLLAWSVARDAGDARAPELRIAAERQANYLRALADDEGRLPLLGDDDGGQLFPICGRPSSDCRDTLANAAVLLERPDLQAGDTPEETFWLCGSRAADGMLEVRRPFVPVASVALRDTGYYVMRAGRGDRLIFDAGPHGFLNGGHAHADALSVVLTAAGRELLVDPGTATYTMDPELRDRFRSTAMHNTVVVDGRSQSEPKGPFHWRTRATASAPLWRSERDFDYVEGLHDGYRPIVHVRGVLSLKGLGWVIIDHLLGGGTATAEANWHLHPDWSVTGISGGVATLAHRDGASATLACSAPLALLDGGPDGLDLYAPEYGRIERASCVRARSAGALPWTFATFIPARATRAAIEPLPLRAAPPAEWHGAAFRLTMDGQEAELVCAVERNGAVEADGAPATSWGTAATETDARVALAGPNRLSILINGHALASSVHYPVGGIAGGAR